MKVDLETLERLCKQPPNVSVLAQLDRLQQYVETRDVLRKVTAELRAARLVIEYARNDEARQPWFILKALCAYDEATK